MKDKSLKKTTIHAPISIGELLDKITILEIKKDKFKDLKLENTLKELNFLKNILGKNSINIPENLFSKLKKINLKLWSIEDEIRIKEKNKEFNKDFIKLARSIYTNNDKRAEIKKEINLLFNSEIVEEKSYEDY